jgi:hypothetical protein
MTVAPDDAAIPLRKLRTLRVRPRYCLEVQWEPDGPPMIIDMEDLIAEGTAFAPLHDPDLFATVRIGERHRTIEWPDPMYVGQILTDYDADALYLRGEKQAHDSFVQRLMKEFQLMRRRLMHLRFGSVSKPQAPTS